MRAPVGALNIADQQYGIGRGLCAISPKNEQIHSGFLWYLLHHVRTGLNFESTGSTYEAVSVEDVGNLFFLIPSFIEQTTIATFLDCKTSQIDTLIDKVQKSIELLREKRSALITAAVTGKIDVREKAA